MPDGMRSIAVSTLGLDIVAAIALLLTLSRYRLGASEPVLRSTIRVASAAVLCQAAHFGEELVSGFARRFPEELGLSPMPTSLFAGFNLFWLAIWTLAIVVLRARYRPALFPLWFLAIASVGNGVAHPVLAAAQGGYFPGLVTSPLVGIAGALLIRQLASCTRADAAPAPASSRF